MQILLAGLAGLFFVSFVVSALIASRRSAEIRLFGDAEKENQAAIEKVSREIEDKRGQNKQLSSQLDKVREEERRLKKKVYTLEQAGKTTGPTPEQVELDRIQEQALEEARAELAASRAATERANEEVSSLQAINERLKTEVEEARRESKARSGGDSAKGKRLDDIERENKSQAKKLEAARRKARNDEQVYRVTKSKLELAMEKIAALQKTLADKDHKADAA
ncbi:MAG TPA: hypothetical protein VM425_01470 [Myxococcota bacterium]|nr:hypothetical protein [Myxococcota bacterium]